MNREIILLECPKCVGKLRHCICALFGFEYNTTRVCRSPLLISNFQKYFYAMAYLNICIDLLDIYLLLLILLEIYFCTGQQYISLNYSASVVIFGFGHV